MDIRDNRLDSIDNKFVVVYKHGLNIEKIS